MFNALKSVDVGKYFSKLEFPIANPSWKFQYQKSRSLENPQ